MDRLEMTVYISGPISGTGDYLARFQEAAFKLKGAGYKKIINPAQLDGVMIGATQEVFLDICLKLVDKADLLVMLPGWENSKGSNREVGFAIARRKPFIPMEEVLRQRQNPEV